jgi:hypothetical protein
MASDPKAPGAAAVYLDIAESADDQLHTQSYYARIKVLTEKGKELATVSIPYGGNFKVTDIQARTIHADGTVVPLEGKPEDLLVAKSGDVRVGRKVFTLPSVEVGSILEYRYDLEYPDDHVSSPTWDVQRPYFVHHAHYAFTPFKGFLKGDENLTSHYLMNSRGQVLNNLMWWMRLPSGQKLDRDAMGRFSLDVTDVPANPDEEWMPPIQSYLYRVFFYYMAATNASDFWTSEAKQWSKDVDHFAEPSQQIRAAVGGLIAPGDSDEVKARKLYVAVQALDNTDFSRQKSESELKELKLRIAKRAEDTLAQKSGSSEDIALLYLAMLRAAGLKAYAAKVVGRENGPFDPGYMDADQFDDTMVIADLGGKETLLDPGERMCPFMAVSWNHSGVTAMRQSVQGSGFTITPEQNYKLNALTRQADLTLDQHGGVTGSITFVMAGQEALRWRQRALENDDAEVKKQFDRELEGMVPNGVDAHVDHFLGMDNPDDNLLAMVKVTGSMGTATAKRLILPGYFFETRSREPFVDEAKRTTPVDMRYGDMVTDVVKYHLPAGMTVEGAPQDADLPWTGHALYVTKSKSDPGTLEVQRLMARGFAECKPEEYETLRGFYSKVATDDQQELVLREGAEAKGN